MRPTVTGPHGAQQTITRTRRRVSRCVLLATVLCLAAGFVAASAPVPGASAATTLTTQPSAGPLAPVVRPGQPYVTPGHAATKGPIGPNPSQSNGIPLTVLHGLQRGEPIFNGDFADPYALGRGDTHEQPADGRQWTHTEWMRGGAGARSGLARVPAGAPAAT